MMAGEIDHSQSITDTARADWECRGCGLGFYGREMPTHCHKCGGSAFVQIRPIFLEIEAVINRIRDAAREGYGAVTHRRHRKGRFIAAQFQRAIEAMDHAQRALIVAGGKRE